jgi:protoporphyrinogen/coproporphyrinogen III oxidase
MKPDRIVIGAGIAGLLSAKRAVERGESVLVLSETVGGLIDSMGFSDPRIGLRLDSGAEAFSTVSQEVMALIQELGLSNQLAFPSAEPARIIGEADRYPIPRGVMGIPANLEDPELLAIFSQAEIAHAKSSDSQAFGDYETVADLIRARLGEPFLERLVNPVFAGVHGSSAEKISAQAALGPILSKARELGSLALAVASTKTSARPGASVASLIGGMSLLTNTLRKTLEDSGVVFRLEAAESVTKSDRGWETRSSTASFSTPAISICAPAEFLAHRVLGLEEIALAAAEIATVDVALVMLLVRSKELSKYPLGPGALITETAGISAKATTHVNAKWQWIEESLAPDLHVIRLSYGRNGLFPKGDLVERAKTELFKIYQVSDAEIIDEQLIHWPKALVQSNREARERLDVEIAKLHSTGLEVCGGYLTGNGILGLVKDHNQRRAA